MLPLGKSVIYETQHYNTMSEQRGRGTISANDLMSKLVQSKKVMNKVDAGKFSKSDTAMPAPKIPNNTKFEIKQQRTPTELTYDDSGINIPNLVNDMYNQSPMMGGQPNMQSQGIDVMQQNTRPVGQGMTREKIKASPLPDIIKEAMMNSSIPDIKMTDSFDLNFDSIKEQINNEQLIAEQSQQQYSQSPDVSVTKSLNEETLAGLTPIIENIIRKTLDEIVESKINQILTAQETATINETLVLKVGNSVFSGKITNVRKIN